MFTKIYLATLIAAFLLLGCSPRQESSEISDSNKNQYIVVFNDTQVTLFSSSLNSSHSPDSVIKIMSHDLVKNYSVEPALKTFSRSISAAVMKLSESEVQNLRNDPSVAYVEKDGYVSINSTQTSAPWGLDRIDQQNLPLDQNYTSIDSGTNVNAYVIDTGVLTTHQDFQGRANHGIDIVDNDGDATDCNGHGTHVAATIAGATYGVAKHAKIFAVRVLDCQGSGQFSDVIAGIDWVTANHVKPAVANMSLGGPISQSIEDAMTASIRAGVTYVVAAGNENSDACLSSPARLPSVITVGSVKKSDARSSFSNFGTCVDIFAPGSDILSAWINSNTSTNTISGTSMASPHVAGVAALYLSIHPQHTPAQVAAALVAGASSGRVLDAAAGSPNKLLNTQFLASEGGVPPLPPVPPAPQPPVPPSGDPELKNNIEQVSLAGVKGNKKYYVINIPANVSGLTVTLSGGTGDADLYLQKNEKPTLTKYSCRPFKSSNSESCTVQAPATGKWYVMLNAFATYSGATLRAQWNLKP